MLTGRKDCKLLTWAFVCLLALSFPLSGLSAQTEAAANSATSTTSSADAAPAKAVPTDSTSSSTPTPTDKSVAESASASDGNAPASTATQDSKPASTATDTATKSTDKAKTKADPADQPDAIDNAAQDATAVITGKEKPLDLLQKYKLRFVLWLHKLVPEVIQAFLITFAGYILARILRITFLRFSKLRNWDEAISEYFGLVIYISVLVVFIISALKALGFPVTSMLASFGISGVIIGLGVRAQLNNYFAGVAMLAARPFQKDDLVEFGPPVQIGIVKHVNMTNTVFDTLDKVRLVVPNGVVWRGYIKNYSRNSERIIRFDLIIPQSVELAWVRDLAAQILTANEHVMQDPPPLLDVAEVTPDGIRAVLKAQCKVEAVQIFTQLVEDLRSAFEEAGLDVKLPAKGVRLKVEE